MTQAPAKPGSGTTAIRRAGERFTALLLALLFAISLPVASAGFEANFGAPDTSARSSLAPHAVPDVAELLPLDEAAREADRTRSSDIPIVLADISSPAQRAAVLGGIVFTASPSALLRSAGFLPFSRGPPERS